MIPNQTHLDLLEQLPAEVHAKLRECGPGWVVQDCKDTTRLWLVLRMGPQEWEVPDCEPVPFYWLPCSADDIHKIAMETHGGRDQRRGMYWDGEDGYEASLSGNHSAPDAVGRMRETTNVEAGGGDPHEAALRLLLAVLGGGDR